MISNILDFSITKRWLVVSLCIAAAAFGAWAVGKVPIDAVPDITNNQVQINTLAPALSPVEIEKQVTFPGRDGARRNAGLLYTRSLSRNGFSQVTAVLRRPHQYLLCAPAGERAPAVVAAIASAGRRAEDGAGLHRPRRNLHVVGEL